MKAYLKNGCLTGLLMLAGMSAPVQSAELARWYTDEQVRQGQKVFAESCSACHGKNAEATTNWRKRDAQGHWPPPPLNGTAHAWHHPMKILRQQIRKGGAPVGGIMPPFEGKLADEEIDSVIAWFQSKWSDDIYRKWQQRDSGTGFQLVETKVKKQHPPMRLLRKGLPGVDIGEPEPTPVKGLYQVKVGADYVYLSAEGRYAVIGELIDLQTGNNLTELSEGRDNLDILKHFPETDMVIFPADGEAQQTITVLTDTDCPFCRKLHKEVPRLQNAGIRVRYIPFPRGGEQGEGYEHLKSVWCAKDRKKAMNIAKGIEPGELQKGDCEAAKAVDRGYELGLKIGLRGTPAIILENGRMLQGYLPASKLIQLSRSNQKEQ